jgi:hypothetical protein
MVPLKQENIAKIVLDAVFEVHSRLRTGRTGEGLPNMSPIRNRKSGVFITQILSYCGFSVFPYSFLFNFNVRSFKDGIKRVVLNDKNTYSTYSTLRFSFFLLTYGSRMAQAPEKFWVKFSRSAAGLVDIFFLSFHKFNSFLSGETGVLYL